MSKYTVLIMPTMRTEHTGERCSLRIEVDLREPHAKITGVSITTDHPDGITKENYPEIDIAGISNALAEKFSTPRPSEPVRMASTSTHSGPRKAAGTTPNDRNGSGEPNEPAKQPTADKPGRAYRKMPNPKELSEKLNDLGTVTALAVHYDVPRHTAQGWVGRLRKLGK